MQTFLPHPDFVQTASCLDYRRLGKQRVECLQILKALADPSYGWQNHPAVKMWRGHSRALAKYAEAICKEWISRGYKDTCLGKLAPYKRGPAANPSWIGNQIFHASHRAALLAKDFAHYSQFDWKEKPELNYYWPTAQFRASEEYAR